MSKVALVPFKGTIARKVAAGCSGFDRFEVGSSSKAINGLVTSGRLEDYDLIIAMGLKNGSKDTFVHVEQICLVEGKELGLDISLADEGLFRKMRMSTRLEKSWCNMLAGTLRTAYPNKRVAFLHIPPNVKAGEVAVRLIESLA